MIITKGGVSSTFRDSKTAPFKWREQLTMKEVILTKQDLKTRYLYCALFGWGMSPYVRHYIKESTIDSYLNKPS